MRLRYEIVLRLGQWEVRFHGRRDPELTIAIRQAVTMSNGEPIALDTQRKAVRFLRRFLNFRHRRGQDRNTFIRETVLIARIRIEAFLRRQGFEIAYDTNRFDGSCHVRGVSRSISELPVWLAALSRLYAALARLGLRGRANPMKVDRWHLMLSIEKFGLAETMLGSRSSNRTYRGSQYLAKGRRPAPLRVEDARHLRARVLEAGTAAAWPPSMFNLVDVIGVEGSRWSSTAPLTAADWARSSGFQRSIWAPSKRSGSQRVFHIVISVDQVLRLRQSFDDDPSRPDMAELERLHAAKDWEALEKIYLFPSRNGLPYSYHTFNNHYFRPAMEAAGLLIHGKNGSVRPGAHRLRSARIQEGVDDIVRSGRSLEECEPELQRLQEDVHIKSKAAFDHYVGDRMQELGIATKIKRFDEKAAKAAKARDEGHTPQTRKDAAKTEGELYFEQIEREEASA